MEQQQQHQHQHHQQQQQQHEAVTLVVDEHGKETLQVNMTSLPSTSVVWLNIALDTMCLPLQCTDKWRDWIGVSSHSTSHSSSSTDHFLNHQIPFITQVAPKPLTFDEFREMQKSSSSLSSSSSPPPLPSLLYQYAFQTSDTTSLGVLSTPTAMITLFLLTYVIRSIKKFLKPIFHTIAVRTARQTHGVDWEQAVENQERIHKFGEYLFRLLYHSSVSLYGILYFFDKPWWGFLRRSNHPETTAPTIALFRGFPNQPVLPGMAWYYLIQAAYNLDALISLLEMSFEWHWNWNNLFLQPQPNNNTCNNAENNGSKSTTTSFFPISLSWSPTVRGDFREMFIHHVITNILTIVSSHLRLTRTGSMVFLVHDISDIPVDLSKLANFLKWKRTTIVCFALMMVTWFVTRLYCLPFVIFRSVLFESHWVLETGSIPPMMYMCYRHLFYVLVALLIFLHVAWFAMFLQILHTIVTKSEVHDYSEHKKGETITNGSKINTKSTTTTNGSTAPPAGKTTTNDDHSKKKV